MACMLIRLRGGLPDHCGVNLQDEGWMPQVVLLGVYLLAPGKRAYLRSLKDTEEVLLQHRWHASLCWKPVEA